MCSYHAARNRVCLCFVTGKASVSSSVHPDSVSSIVTLATSREKWLGWDQGFQIPKGLEVVHTLQCVLGSSGRKDLRLLTLHVQTVHTLSLLDLWHWLKPMLLYCIEVMQLDTFLILDLQGNVLFVLSFYLSMPLTKMLTAWFLYRHLIRLRNLPTISRLMRFFFQFLDFNKPLFLDPLRWSHL